jgi:hypothetical protein
MLEGEKRTPSQLVKFPCSPITVSHQKIGRPPLETFLLLPDEIRAEFGIANGWMAHFFWLRV